MSPEERIQVLLDAPSDGWVAFSKDEARFIAYGKSYEEALSNAINNGEDGPVLEKVPANWNEMVL